MEEFFEKQREINVALDSLNIPRTRKDSPLELLKIEERLALLYFDYKMQGISYNYFNKSELTINDFPYKIQEIIMTSENSDDKVYWNSNKLRFIVTNQELSSEECHFLDFSSEIAKRI